MDEGSGRQQKATGSLALESRRGQPVAAVLLALVALLVAFYLGQRLGGQLSIWPLVGLGVLAAAGFFALLGMIAGIVHVGSMPRRRAFLDGLSDAVEDAFVVTDRRGRVVHANERYHALLAEAGLKRVVGVENLYAGHPEVSDRIYRLAQAARSARRRP